MGRLKKSTPEFAAQVNLMVANVDNALLAQAGVTTNSWNAIESQATGFNNTITAVETTKAAAESAVSARIASEKDLREDLQLIVDKFYATPSIKDEQLRNIGLPSRTGYVGPIDPITVADLSVAPLIDGAPQLKWKRNGNSRTTIFEIELQTSGSWSVIGTTLKTKWTDETATPGEMRTYRVVSKNTRGRSRPSQTVTIYGGMESSTLRIAA